MDSTPSQAGATPGLAELVAGARAIIAIPTTEPNLREAAALADTGAALVVADRARFPAPASALTPVELLDAHPLRNRPPAVPIVSFTDQFVDATNAPLAVAVGDAREFRSSVEVVASARFQWPLAFLCGRALSPAVTVTGDDRLVEALRRMGDFLDACKALGDAWLARGIQSERTVEHRRRAAALLARRYASLVMASAVGSAPGAAHLRLIGALTGPGN